MLVSHNEALTTATSPAVEVAFLLTIVVLWAVFAAAVAAAVVAASVAVVVAAAAAAVFAAALAVTPERPGRIAKIPKQTIFFSRTPLQ